MASGWTLVEEGRAFFGTGGPISQQVAAIAGGGLQPAASEYSKRMLLDQCRVTMSSVYASVAPGGTRTSLIAGCADIAAVITREVPVHGYAWVVAAQAAMEQGDGSTFNRDLAASKSVSPNEVWLAYLRYYLARLYESDLNPEGEATYDADLGVLIRSNAGIDELAARYRDEPAFRPRITAAVEKLPNQLQVRFLDAIKRAVSAGTT